MLGQEQSKNKNKENSTQTQIPEKKPKSKKKIIVKILGILLAILILGFMIYQFIKNWQDIKPYLVNVKVGVLIIAVIFYAIAFLATGYNWAYLLWKLDSKLTKREYLNIHMVSALARYIPGGIWNIVGKAYMCTEKGVEKTATTASMILEYVFQIISSGMFLLFFLPVFLKEGFTFVFFLIFLAALMLVLVLLPWGVRFGTKLLGKIFKEDLSNIYLTNKYVYLILCRYIAVWFFTGIGLIILVKAFSEIEIVQGIYLILSYPISWVVGFLSPSPNGMGIREGVLSLLLGNSYSYELVLLITLTTRIWTMLGEAAAFVGYQIYYYLWRYRRIER